MSVDGNTTWSFGDGDYGKLGLGNSTAKATPAKVEALLGLGVKKVACGTQFTIALTRDGKVFTWGQGTRCCDASQFVGLWNLVNNGNRTFLSHNALHAGCQYVL